MEVSRGLFAVQDRYDSLLCAQKYFDTIAFDRLNSAQKKGVRPSPHARF